MVPHTDHFGHFVTTTGGCHAGGAAAPAGTTAGDDLGKAFKSLISRGIKTTVIETETNRLWTAICTDTG